MATKKKTTKKKAKKKIVKKKSKKKAGKKKNKKVARLPRKELFPLEYIKDFNATRAAEEVGYSKKTARQAGARLLSKADIQKKINQLINERSERTKIDADWLLERLADEAEADVADLYTDEGSLRPVNQWPEIWRKGLVAGLDVHQEYSYEDGKRIPDGLIMKVKLSDRIKRLELIGKHVNIQAFKDKIEHSGSIDLTGKTEQELKDIVSGKSTA